MVLDFSHTNDQQSLDKIVLLNNVSLSYHFNLTIIKKVKYNVSVLVHFLLVIRQIEVPEILRLVYVSVSLSQDICINIDLDSLDIVHINLTIFSALLVNLINFKDVQISNNIERTLYFLLVQSG